MTNGLTWCHASADPCMLLCTRWAFENDLEIEFCQVNEIWAFKKCHFTCYLKKIRCKERDSYGPWLAIVSYYLFKDEDINYQKPAPRMAVGLGGYKTLDWSVRGETRRVCQHHPNGLLLLDGHCQISGDTVYQTLAPVVFCHLSYCSRPNSCRQCLSPQFDTGFLWCLTYTKNDIPSWFLLIWVL